MQKSEQKSKIYVYLRVSTEDQTLENSKLKILEYLVNNHYDTTNLEYVTEKKSGYKYSYKDRKIGTEILPKIQKGDIMIVNSLSRISRKLSDVLDFVEQEVTKKEFKVIIAKNNMILDNSPLNKLVLSMLAMCAEFEINVLRERTKAGIERYKKENHGKWGRPKGAGKCKLDKHISDVKKMIEDGVKFKFIAEKFNVSKNTVTNFVKKYNLK